jgi:hypothetical protein
VSVAIAVQQFRSAFNARSLEAICQQPDAFANRGERHIVVLAERMQEDLIRATWAALMDEDPEQNGYERMVDQVQINVKRGGRKANKRMKRQA